MYSLPKPVNRNLSSYRNNLNNKKDNNHKKQNKSYKYKNKINNNIVSFRYIESKKLNLPKKIILAAKILLTITSPHPRHIENCRQNSRKV